MIYRTVVKRFIDIVLSLLALVILSPLLIVLAVLVRIKLGSPVIFRQLRPGYKGRVFGLMKFRTMTDERDDEGELLPDEVRLTEFGKKLRATSLDELPEFINILKGDMWDRDRCWYSTCRYTTKSRHTVMMCCRDSPDGHR